MSKRFVSIWFRYLKTDWLLLRRPMLGGLPYVLATPQHGRMVITAINPIAERQGVYPGMVVADARAIIPSLQVLDDKPMLSTSLLNKIAEWCIRYTPVVAVDQPEGLILDATGCAHLWGGEQNYLDDIVTKLNGLGYDVKASMADTVGCAWAMARFGKESILVENGQQSNALFPLPPAALRLDIETVDLLQKLGLCQISDFINMPRKALRRRFNPELIRKLDLALGNEEELIQSIQPVESYQERLPCLEPIVTATGIEIALQRLLDSVCSRLEKVQKGLRIAIFKGFRVDGKIETIEIGTHRATHNPKHLFKLFEPSLSTIEPALGIEVFLLEAKKTENVSPVHTTLWETSCGLDDNGLSELLDRLVGKYGADHIHRYLPEEHYWPERSVKLASSLSDKINTGWKIDRPRPVQLLSKPEQIEVTAPIPDYPPMSFRHNGKLHTITKADGPERIEQEWWLQEGQHRDYYCVEDEEGKRYWLFRSGHYSSDKSYCWFIHGFFA